MYQVVTPSRNDRHRPGTMPARNNWPTEAELTGWPSGPVAFMPAVAIAYITRLIDGGNRMPSAPEVVITPAPKRFG